jgi:hypothetical protein
VLEEASALWSVGVGVGVFAGVGLGFQGSWFELVRGWTNLSEVCLELESV